MNKLLAFLIAAALLFCLAACGNGEASPDASDPPTEAAQALDPYALENRYDVGKEMFTVQEGVDYGTVCELTYPSTVAGDDKRCCVLLPAGYDESKTYPVIYVAHTFGGSPEDLIAEGSYLTVLYGNMLADGLAVPMIIVAFDLYTDPAAEKNGKTGAELRQSYNKVIEEIRMDLMPFIEKSYPVSTAREDTAVAGTSEGAVKALCIGFTWPEEFGWIGSFSPVAGVIPTEFEKYTMWNEPAMQDFPKLTEEEAPRYVYLAAGSQDSGSTGPALFYGDVLTEYGIRNQADIAEGFGHTVSLWQQCFYNFLSKAFK